ncbi:hypothetical protein BTVI_88700 [Pitangus sulphuratus]|nr:hypothetical protein BTVI_88700 [Pitangus sulphuratus]
MASPAITTGRGGWRAGGGQDILALQGGVICGAWSGDLMGGGGNAGPTDRIEPAPKVTSMECEAMEEVAVPQHGPCCANTSSTELAALLICLGEENLSCRRLSEPPSPPRKKNRLNGEKARTLITKYSKIKGRWCQMERQEDSVPGLDNWIEIEEASAKSKPQSVKKILLELNESR